MRRLRRCAQLQLSAWLCACLGCDNAAGVAPPPSGMTGAAGSSAGAGGMGGDGGVDAGGAGGGPDLSGAVELASASSAQHQLDQFCARLASGALYCWGNGNLGAGDAEPHATPVQIGGDRNWTAVGASVDASCGIRAGRLYCWGRIPGTGEPEPAPDDPGQIDPVRIGDGTDWSDIGEGQQAICGTRAGARHCWGRRDLLGDGDEGAPQYLAPQLIGSDTDWQAVEIGHGGGCGLRSGALFCWDHSAPEQVGATSSYTQVSLGEAAYAIAGGALFRVYHVQLQWTAEPVGADLGWTFVSATLAAPTDPDPRGYRCGIRAGALYCWGDNSAGQLGLGDLAPRSAPTRVGGEGDWTHVNCSLASTCGIRGGAVHCWGANAHGQLGLGDTEGRLEPVGPLAFVP